MLGREENWSQRNRSFILGFAIAVVVLNIVFAVILPSKNRFPLKESLWNMRWRTRRLK